MDPPRRLSPEALLTNLYAAFNERDIPALLAAMSPDVSWPNGWEGGVLRGRGQVGAYWRRQWDQLEPVVTPTAFRTEADGRIAVTVHQVVHDKAGAKLADHTVTHVYRLDNGLVSAMDIRE
ncbi:MULTISPECIES: nuclear transport factor 2 family protein [unclassified Micromonospora]|uniref:nuclear transport factor 2 family protein n=1 Tax=unclassified Micromonospora TaxID=2617518 RepID=UPI0033C5C43A